MALFPSPMRVVLALSLFVLSGTGPVVIRERLHEIDVPVLALSADMDKQCSIRASRSTLEVRRWSNCRGRSMIECID